MSWEAYRWTAKTPSELYQTLGPQGVDDLVRQMLDACWREHPEEGRSLPAVRKVAQGVFDRNMAVGSRIKKPSPAAFFADLSASAADGFLRQAMVVCWMMLPRAGGRDLRSVRQIIGEIYERNLTAWSHDDATFTGKKAKRAKAKPGRPVSKPRAQAASKRPTRKK